MDVNDVELPPSEIVQNLYRLIHHWCEIGDDTYAWRADQIKSMCGLLDAEMSVSYVMRFSLDPADIGPKTLVYLEHGTNDAWKQYLAKGDVSADPVTPYIMQRFGTDFTCRREDWIDDATWRATPYFRDVAVPAKLEHVIYSQVAVVEPSVVDGFSICRSLGRPAFTASEVATVRFMHQELARLWRRPDPLGVHTLPLRQRQTLAGIRRGENRKVIAEKMGVSDHTVHSYEKLLFERAGVSGRGELLAQVAKLMRPSLLP